MKLFKTLRARFALWTALLLFVILVIFGVLVYVNMARGLMATIDDTLTLNASQAVLGLNAENGQLSSLQGFVQNLEGVDVSETGFTIRVLDAQGAVLQEVGAYHSLPVPSSTIKLAQQGKANFITISLPSTDKKFRVYSAPITENSQPIGVIQVAHSLDEVSETLEKLLTILMFSIPVLAIATAIGGYFLAKRALLPVDKITRTAYQIASTKDLSARLNMPNNDDEVSRLATTFDTMLTQLEEAFRRERQFTSDASHELRTPLAAMQTILSSTMTRRRTVNEYEQALTDLSAESHRMKLLIEELLHLARRDSGNNPLNYEPIDLSQLLEDVMDSLFPLAEEKGLIFEQKIQSNIIIKGDRDTIVRMFVNIVGNAIKYTMVGSIAVQALTQNDICTVTVADTGIGIPAEHVPHIFDRFYRVEHARSTEGTGLGLSIALEIARAHGGDILIDSMVGEGTTVTVHLPVLRH